MHCFNRIFMQRFFNQHEEIPNPVALLRPLREKKRLVSRTRWIFVTYAVIWGILSAGAKKFGRRFLYTNNTSPTLFCLLV
jgi:hypothetical protein